MKKAILIVCVVAVVVGIGSVAVAEVNIETVHVGNPGNAGEQSRLGVGDTTYYGGVAYEYNIGKYEVTAGQYIQFLNAMAATDTYGLYNSGMDSSSEGCQITRLGSSGSYTYDFSGRPNGTDADWVNRPVNFVSWGDTARFANWMHNDQPTGAQDFSSTEDGAYDLSATQSYYGPNGETPAYASDDWYALKTALIGVTRKPGATWVIPTQDEWYKAAYYDAGLNSGAGGYYDCPTSSDTVPGYVNNSGILSGTSTPFTDGVTDPDNYATYDGDGGRGDGGIDGIGSPYYRTIVGEWENSDSPYGTFDQGGNVWEWNETLIGLVRGCRGGSFTNDEDGLFASHLGRKDPAYENSFTGFRVSEVPEPATIALLALGGLAMLRRRQK